MQKISIGVLGMGAIGTVMSHLLHGNKALQLRGFNRSPVSRLQLIDRETRHQLSISCLTRPEAPQELDWLIVCLKAYHFHRAKDWWDYLITPHTRVVVIRNGLDLKKPVLPYCPEDRILEGLIDCPVQNLGEKTYRIFSPPVLTFPQSELAIAFQDLLPSRGVVSHLSNDFKTASWEKLIESASIGALTCLSGETCWIFQQKNIRILYAELVQEAVEVARADGARIPPDFVSLSMAKVATYAQDKGSSMLTDRQRGQPIELEAKSGAILMAGKRLGIPTPLHQLVCTLLQATNMK